MRFGIAFGQQFERTQPEAARGSIGLDVESAGRKRAPTGRTKTLVRPRRPSQARGVVPQRFEGRPSFAVTAGRRLREGHGLVPRPA